MKVTPVTELPGLIIFEPRVFTDDRGYFLETFHTTRYAELGVQGPFVQDNWSHSIKGTLRGLHYQQPHTQAKLVHVAHGAIWDVAVDIRKGSPTFAKWFAVELSADNHKQLYIPPGFAHGFYVLTETADFVYKCTDFYAGDCDRGMRWNDPAIGIKWPLVGEPLLSAKDKVSPMLKDAVLL